jgi:hypothetical protein
MLYRPCISSPKLKGTLGRQVIVMDQHFPGLSRGSLHENSQSSECAGVMETEPGPQEHCKRFIK